MRIPYLPLVRLFWILPFVTAAALGNEPWTVAGAGNSTCSNWQAAGPTQQGEILSWMTGFASAVNVSNASRGLPQMKLGRLTNVYLRAEITSTCAVRGNAKVPMVTVIFRILKDLPLK